MKKNSMKTKSVQSINPFKSVIQTSYDSITKAHSVTIEVECVEEEEATFVMKLPI